MHCPPLGRTSTGYESQATLRFSALRIAANVAKLPELLRKG
jgi:hypothetical protein